MNIVPLANKPFRISSLYHKQISLSAKFVQDEQGWMRVESFIDSTDEKNRTEEGVSVADLSNLGKLDLKGHDLLKILKKNYLPARNIRVGTVVKPKSKDLRETLCCILSDDEAMFLTNPSALTKVTNHLTADETSCFQVTDVSSVLACLYLIGPRSRDVISKLTELNVNSEIFPNLTLTRVPIAHVQCFILRVDLGELLGYQIYFERAYGEYLWDSVMHAGEEFRIGGIGLSAMKKLGWTWE